MNKELAVKQIKPPFYQIRTVKNTHVFSLMVTFLILNTLKITLFNYFIIPIQTHATFNYKFLITLLLAIIIYPIIFKCKSILPFIIIYILQLSYIIANMSYYLFYHNYVHILQWITLFKEAFLSAGHSSAPINFKMLIILIDIPAFAYIVFNYSRIVSFNAKIRFQRAIMTIAVIIIITSIEITNYSHGLSVVQFTKDQSRGESPIVERYGTLINNAVSLYLNRGEKGHEKNLIYGKEQARNVASVDKPNFIIIQVESMDANVINQKYKDQYIAPFLHSLAYDNIYYPYVMSYHMGGGTSDSEFSIINSVQPLEDYPAIKLADYNYSNSLVKKLAASSYKTVAFHGNVGDFYNRDVAFPKMGFNSFFDVSKMKFKDIGWGAPDDDVFNYTVNKLKTVKQPFFSYTITMTSHTPFTSAENYYKNELYTDISDETTRNYFNSMSYVDQSIKDYITQIQANFKNTYIFIWGDHTPNIETDTYKQASFSMDNKYFEFVPLIIVTPNHKVYTEQTQIASFLDLSPTILYASGIKFDLKSNGQNLINPKGENNVVLFKGATYDRKELYNKLIETIKAETK